MQPTHRSSRILQPAKLWFVYFSLFLALGLEYIPSGRVPGIPDWVPLVLAIWCVREPLRVGMGVGFVFGLLVDVGHEDLHPLLLARHDLDAAVEVRLLVTLAGLDLAFDRPDINHRERQRGEAGVWRQRLPGEAAHGEDHRAHGDRDRKFKRNQAGGVVHQRFALQYSHDFLWNTPFPDDAGKRHSIGRR